MSVFQTVHCTQECDQKYRNWESQRQEVEQSLCTEKADWILSNSIEKSTYTWVKLKLKRYSRISICFTRLFGRDMFLPLRLASMASEFQSRELYELSLAFRHCSTEAEWTHSARTEHHGSAEPGEGHGRGWRAADQKTTRYYVYYIYSIYIQYMFYSSTYLHSYNYLSFFMFLLLLFSVGEKARFVGEGSACFVRGKVSAQRRVAAAEGSAGHGRAAAMSWIPCCGCPEGEGWDDKFSGKSSAMWWLY